MTASKPWRVVRLTGHGNGVDVCAHRFHWVAWRCAGRMERREPIGVWFEVRPAVTP